MGVHYFGVVCFDDLADIPSAAVAHFGVVPVEYIYCQIVQCGFHVVNSSN